MSLNKFLLFSLIFFTASIVKGQANLKNTHLTGNVVTDDCKLPLFWQTIDLQGNFAEAADIKVTLDKGYILLGMYAPPTGSSRGMIAKLNQFGNVEWVKEIARSFVSSYSVFPRRVIPTADSGFIVALETSSFEFNGNVLLKFDKNGTLAWQKFYDIQSNTSIVLDATGTTDNAVVFSIQSGSSCYITKVNADNGNVIWGANYGAAEGYMNAKGITVLNNSVYFVSSGVTNAVTYASIVKLEANTGNITWAKNYTLPNTSPTLSFNTISSHNNSLTISGSFNGNMAISPQQGYFQFTEAGAVEKAIMIQNANNRIYTDDFYQYPVFSEDGTIGAHGFLGDTSDAFIFKLAPDNSIKWQKRYTYPGGQGIAVIRNTSDGGAITAGPAGSLGMDKLLHIIKIDTIGRTGGCPMIDAGITISNVTLSPSNKTVNKSNTTLVQAIPVNLFSTPGIVYSANKLCSINTECADIQLTGPADICKKDTLYKYQVIKDPACTEPITFSVSDNNIAQIVSQTATEVTIKYLQPGSVEISVNLQFLCNSVKQRLPVTIHNNPDTLDLGPDLNLCANGVYELNAHAGYTSYQWQDNSTDSLFTIAAPGTYYVTAMDKCGRSWTDTVKVIAAPVEPFDIGTDTKICRNDTITLNATAGFLSYQWAPDYKISSTTGPSVKVYPQIDTVYTIKATKRPGCTILDTIRVSLFPTPVISLQKDTSICAGTSLVLDAGPGFIKYEWSTGEINQSISVSQKDIYKIKATDNNGCHAADEFELMAILPGPIVHLSKDTAICNNKNLLLDAGPGYSKYLWQDNSTAQTFSIAQTGQYWVTVTDAKGCFANSDTTSIKEIHMAPANFIYADTAICRSQTLVLKPATNFSAYLWSTGQRTPEITINKEGLYWLQVTGTLGCQGKQSITVTAKNCLTAVYFPNAFTPNNDSNNDLFRPSVYGELASFYMQVYNRYGQLIFTTNNYSKGWDGTHLSKPQNAGTFTYIATYSFNGTFKETVKGTVILLR